MDKERCILVIKMYNGDYLNEGSNIGHEVINLFRADNGRHYIYCLPGGTIGVSKDGKVTDILLVQNVGNNTLKVLARINNISSDQHIAKHCKFSKEEIQQNVINYALEQNVTYNQKPISSIFVANKYNSEQDISSVNFTFEVESEQYREPLNDIYLTSKTGQYALSNTKFRQTEYFTSANKEDFRTLCALIDDDTIWQNEDTAPFVNNRTPNPDRYTFLTLCHKEYDELSYSNMLAYYFENNPAILQDFVNKILGLPFKAPFSIKREYKHTDILIENADGAIILENKIKSGINGLSEDGRNQLDKYVEEISKQYGLENTYGFVLCPNYNIIKISNYKNAANQHLIARYYTKSKENVIPYIKLFDFFDIYKENVNDKYYEDFLKALKLHSSKSDTTLRDIMLERFLAITKK